jgi:hypothetical protein
LPVPNWLPLIIQLLRAIDRSSAKGGSSLDTSKSNPHNWLARETGTLTEKKENDKVRITRKILDEKARGPDF